MTSTTNPRFRQLRTLGTAAGIREHGLALVSGGRLTGEFARQFPDRVTAVVARKEDSEDSLGDLNRFPVWRFGRELFCELDSLGTKRPLVVAQVEPMPRGTTPGIGPALVLPLQNPDNLGAAVRSALAFGVTNIILPRGAAHPFLPRSIRSSANTVFRAAFTTVGALGTLNFDPDVTRLLAADGVPLADADLPPAPLFVLGEEGRGLPDSLGALPRVAIPQAPSVESLNATVALSIALYHWRCVAPRTRAAP